MPDPHSMHQAVAHREKGHLRSDRGYQMQVDNLARREDIEINDLM